MDYYSYQRQCQENINEVLQPGYVTTDSTTNNVTIPTNYGYPSIVPPSYQHADPRFNYAYYNNSIQGSSNMFDLSAKSIKNIDIKSDDELGIETWLSKIGKIQINLNSTIEIKLQNEPVIKNKTNSNYIQIHTARNSLKNCMTVLDKLEYMHTVLKSNASTMSSADWKKNTLEIGVVKDNFSKMISQFENPDTMLQLRKTVELRRKKRLRQKRSRKQKTKNRQVQQETCRKAHKEIDQWLENMKEEVERTKMEENMKKDADCVLAEVTKTKGDARKALTLINSLVKLRQLREQSAVQKGEKTSTEDHAAFAKVTQHLTKIWGHALNVYSKEEQALLATLQKTAAEDTNAARIAKERKITNAWELALFGPKCIPSTAYWGLTSAEKDLETFIAIRKSWDTFLCNKKNENRSAIPIGWILPNLHPQQSWTEYLSGA